MAFVVQLLNHLIVGILVREEECAAHGAAVRIFAVFKHFPVAVVVVLIDRVTHADQYHLGCLNRVIFAQRNSLMAA